MNANDAQLVRVYPRQKGGIIFENTLESNAAFEVVIEAKAGTALFGTGGRYEFQIFVRDLTDDQTIVKKARVGPGKFGDTNWPDPVLVHTFEIPAQGAKKEGHVYEIIATLT
ncbi:MAG: hypothetical protein D6814_15215, partial [Calditrichaeota bacterium]